MVAGRHKSRTFRRVFVRTPGARTVLHFRLRKPSKTKCSCGAALKGVPRERPYKMMRMNKSKKTVSRPYGGNLCSKCFRLKMITKARVDSK